MQRSDVNSLILDQVDEIEESDLRRFINDILRFERSKMDREQPQYSDRYNELIERYALPDEE